MADSLNKLINKFQQPKTKIMKIKKVDIECEINLFDYLCEFSDQELIDELEDKKKAKEYRDKNPISSDDLPF